MFQLIFALVAFIAVGFKLYYEFTRDVIGPSRKVPRIRPQDHAVNEYLKQIAFYNELSATDKQVFLERVQYFMEHKDFQGMQGQLITDEVRTIVAASAVQVGFRLPNWKFPSYHTFRIYPESFYSNIFRKYLKGGAGTTGQIWFSLQDYRAGYANPTNGINLGLHEMAHALIIEMQNGNADDQFVAAYEEIEKLAEDRMIKIRNRQIDFIREYGGTNHMEFIAVCTEHFFERADEFRSKDRELYDAFMWLYRQEPHTPPSVLQITNLPAEEKIKRNYRYAKWHWSLTLVLLGIFIAPAILIWQLHKVALDHGSIAMICVGVVLASAFFLYRPIVKTSALGTTQFVLCHMFGLGPFVLSVFFLLNNYVPVWKQSETHEIKSLYRISTEEYITNLTDNAFNDEEDFRIISGPAADKVKSGDSIIIVMQFGPFGVPVHSENKFTFRKR